MQSTQTIFFENECCRIEHDTDVNCLILNWKGLLPSKPFREIHVQALNQIRQQKTTKVLWDARRMKTIGSEDARWLETFWLPSAIAAGYRFHAIVESDYVFNQHSIDSIIEKADPDKVTFKLFKDRDLALSWLRSC